MQNKVESIKEVRIKEIERKKSKEVTSNTKKEEKLKELDLVLFFLFVVKLTNIRMYQ